MKPAGLAIALSLATARIAPAQEPPRVTARESVLVRSVKVVLTDRSGKPLKVAPSPSDLEVFEDGTPATVLGIDAVFERRDSRAAPPPPGKLEAAAKAAAAAPLPAAPAARMPQVFYVDTAFLARESVLVTVRSLKGRLDRFLRLGPVEIVVADPVPKVFLAETSDEPAVQGALDRLAMGVVGRDLVARLRTQAAQGSGGGPAPVNALLMDEEKLLVRTALGRLAGWTSTHQGVPGVLYLVSDGFDTSVDFYGESQREDFARESGAPTLASPALTPAAFLGQLFDTSASPMVDAIAALLAARGWIVMPFSLRGYTMASSRFLGGADNPGGFSAGTRYTRPGQMTVGRVALTRPMEPLEMYAAATGGEMISSVSRIEDALDRLSDLFLLTYQVDRPPDGKVHRLKVRSRSGDVVVRTARVVSAGTPVETAGTRALDALLERAPAGDLPVSIRVEPEPGRKGRKRSGRLEVTVQLGDLPRILEKVGAGRMRVTIAVWEPKTAPFVHHDERPLEKANAGGDTWTYSAPIEWPPGAKKLSVFVEELKTGASGSAIAEFPGG